MQVLWQSKLKKIDDRISFVNYLPWNQIWNVETIFTDTNFSHKNICKTFSWSFHFKSHSTILFFRCWDSFWNTYICTWMPPKPLIRKISGTTLFAYRHRLLWVSFWDKNWLTCYHRACKILWILWFKEKNSIWDTQKPIGCCMHVFRDHSALEKHPGYMRVAYWLKLGILFQNTY